MYRIRLLESIADEAMNLLNSASDCEIVGMDFNAEEIDGVITRGKGQVTQDFIDSLPNLRTIARCGVGLDNVDVNYATSRSIQVLNTPGVNSDTIAEHTLGLMLMLQRKLHVSTQEVKNGNWAYRTVYDGDEIRGKTLGILGMGNIGQKVAKMADCFGMEVQYWNLEELDNKFSFRSMEQLLQTSDIVTIHLPLTPETRDLLDKVAFAQMKYGALLINTARGEIVNEKALVEVLKSGQLGGFAADVLSSEPPDTSHPLLSIENVLVTPHAGSLTKRTYDDICTISVRNVLSYLRGESVDSRYLVNSF